jgi:hypothetical protein
MLAVLLLPINVSMAQEKSSQSAVSYTPGLGDMMAVLQLRHSKLWYSAKVRNWDLAEYELGQLNANLKEAARFYAKMPGWDLTDTDKSAALVAEAIKARSAGKFDVAFGQMTAACNTCHETTNRAFILVRTPSRFSPFSNQVFSPREKDRR